VWAGAAVLAALVGISRVYPGVHWTTDVLGGWAFGASWLAVVAAGSAVFARGRGSRGSSWARRSAALRGRLARPCGTYVPARRCRHR